MKIDRTNYEIWLIDMIDGNLSSKQAEELAVFLKNNPDLNDEYNGLSNTTLSPAVSDFGFKDKLKKAPSEITDSQFELLSVMHLEGDLADNQKEELYEIIASDHSKKREFELIQKTRIVPSTEVYKNKKLHYKLTVLQKTVRLSVATISVAAAIILFIIVFPFTSGKQNIITGEIPVTAVKESNQVIENNKELGAAKPVQTTTEAREPRRILSARNTTAEVVKTAIVTIQPEADSSQFDREAEITRVRYSSDFEMNIKNISTALIASTTTYNAAEYDDERSNLSRLFAKTFREKILGQENKTDSPLKGYEIAEAGVDGLNKLFGWEMALDKNNDTNGELNSVYFSSKIIKFNTPVKKTEPLP